MQASERQIQRMDDLETGHLRLSVGPIIEQVLLPEVLSNFLNLTRGAQIKVVTEDDRSLIEQFASSELDVIVGPFEASDTGIDELIEVNMLSEPLIAVTCQEHPLVELGDISIETAVNYQCVAPRPTANNNDATALTILPSVKLFSDNSPFAHQGGASSRFNMCRTEDRFGCRIVQRRTETITPRPRHALAKQLTYSARVALYTAS